MNKHLGNKKIVATKENLADYYDSSIKNQIEKIKNDQRVMKNQLLKVTGGKNIIFSNNSK